MILDASALLALLQDEPGADKVQAVLHRAFISAVNWSDVVQRLSSSRP
jgi:PIN domain nuclease of toxin-antitoxin system